MYHKPILLILLFLSLFLESTLIVFPVFLIISVLLFVLFPKIPVLVGVFLGSIILDILKVTTIGFTALFIFTIFLVLNIYIKSVDIKDFKVVLIITFISSIAYSYLSSYSVNLIIYLLIFGITYGVFLYLSKK